MKIEITTVAANGTTKRIAKLLFIYFLNKGQKDIVYYVIDGSEG